jgi:ketosteroid isomerase-like protein
MENYMKSIALIFFIFIFSIFYINTNENPTPPQKHKNGLRKQVDLVLDGFHDAAAKADKDRYFGFLSKDAIFMGTDARERWTKKEFLQYATPYFDKGKGWTYISKNRHVMFSTDGNFAWFDEHLLNEKYGELRGTGVLRKQNRIWKIVHYSLVFTIPNEVAGKVTQLIKASERTIQK